MWSAQEGNHCKVDRDILRIGAVGDLHGAHAALARVLKHAKERNIDAILLTGDFAPYRPGIADDATASRSHRKKAQLATSALGVPAFWVPGNHDPKELAKGGNLDRYRIEFRGFSFYGLGGAGPHPFGFLYEWTDEEIDALSAPKVDLLLSHTPPLRTTLDLSRSGGHVGSAAIGKLASRGGVTVCGHIHEAPGIARVGRGCALNVGSLGPPFARMLYGEIDLAPKRITARLFDLKESSKAAIVEDQIPRNPSNVEFT